MALLTEFFALLSGFYVFRFTLCIMRRFFRIGGYWLLLGLLIARIVNTSYLSEIIIIASFIVFIAFAIRRISKNKQIQEEPIKIETQ